jgi:ubiquinone/menaquinone biosynthesis C-methylase UbiE
MTEPTPSQSPAANDPASITLFFDAMSGSRNALFRSNPILEYEQQVRSDAVLERLGASRGDTILDLGCGNARDIPPMLQAGATVVGVDLSPGMIEQAKKDLAAVGYHHVQLEVGDATRLRFADATFDKIVCSEVIEHIPAAGVAVREMHRVLKPRGSLILSTPNRRSWYGFDRYVVWERLFRKRWNHPFDNWRTLEELVDLLEQHGFDVSARQTVCFMPGFLLTYRLPSTSLQALLARGLGRAERSLQRLAPRNGYLLTVTAIKRG